MYVYDVRHEKCIDEFNMLRTTYVVSQILLRPVRPCDSVQYKGILTLLACSLFYVVNSSHILTVGM